MADVFKRIDEFTTANSYGDNDLLLVSQEGITRNLRGAVLRTSVENWAAPAVQAAEQAATRAETAQGAAETAKAATEESASNAATASSTASGFANDAQNAASNASQQANSAAQSAAQAQQALEAIQVPDIQIGTVTTLPAGSQAVVTRQEGSPNTAPVFDFGIPRGADGQGAGDMTAAVYDPQGKQQDIFRYTDEAVAAAKNQIDSALSGKQDAISVSGLLKGDGAGNISAAEAGTDYVTPDSLNTYFPKSGGTFSGKVNANTAAMADLTAMQVRDIYFGTAAMEDGVSALPAGVIYFQYKEV